MRSEHEIHRELESARAIERSATEAFFVALGKPGGAAGERAARDSARLAIGDLYRELAEATGDEYVVPLSLGFDPEAAVSGAFLIQDEQQAFLTFNAVRASGDGRSDNCGTAIVEFHCAFSTRFGLPNSESRRGDPLYERGLDRCSIGEVLNSSWAREAEAQNRVSFPDAAPWSVRHFIFSFHDSPVECLAERMTHELSSAPHAATLSSIYAKLESR